MKGNYELNKRRKGFIALILAVCMIFVIMPVDSLARDYTNNTGVASVLDPGDTITITVSGATVKVYYYDADGTTLLTTDRVVGGSSNNTIFIKNYNGTQISAGSFTGWKRNNFTVEMGVTSDLNLIAVTNDVDDDDVNEEVCIHTYEWRTVKSPTADSDGIEAYICTKCGHNGGELPLTGFTIYLKETINTIKNAPPGANLEIDTKRWISFHKSIFDALAERPDVSLTVKFLSEGYKGDKLQFTIPAGYDVKKLPNEEGWAGFLYLYGLFNGKPVE